MDRVKEQGPLELDSGISDRKHLRNPVVVQQPLKGGADTWTCTSRWLVVFLSKSHRACSLFLYAHLCITEAKQGQRGQGIMSGFMADVYADPRQ